MFHRLCCVNILFVVCILNAVAARQHQGIPSVFSPLISNGGCEDTSTLVKHLKSLPPSIAFKSLTSSLTSADNPLVIQEIRNRLIQAIQSGLLKIDHIIKDLENVESHNKNDLLITLFMAISEYANPDCRLSADLNRLLFYLLKKRYLHKNDISLTDRFGNCVSQYSVPDVLTKGTSKLHQIPIPCQCQTALLKTVLKRLSELEARTHTQPQLPLSFPSPAVTSDIPNLHYLVSKPSWQPVTYNIKKHKVRPEWKFSQLPWNIGSLNQQMNSYTHKKVIDHVIPDWNIQRQGQNLGYSMPFYEDMRQVKPDLEINRHRKILRPEVNPVWDSHQFEQNFRITAPKRPFRPTWITPQRGLAYTFPAIPSHYETSNFPTTKQFMIGHGYTTPFHSRAPVPVITSQVPIHKRVAPDDLIKLIPKPKFEKEKKMYDKFVKLMKSPRVQKIIEKINPSRYRNIQDIFDIILTTIKQEITTEEIQEEIDFYFNYKEAAKAGFNYGNLIEALPLPRNPVEQRYYNQMRKFLTSKDIYNLLRNLHLNNSFSLPDKLIEVLKYLLSNGTVPAGVVGAANYYLPLLIRARSNIHFDDLVPLLPAPSTPEGKVHYNTLRSLLAGNDIYMLMENVPGLEKAQNKQELLNLVLRRLKMNAMPAPISSAATYYQNLIALRRFGYNYFNLLNLLNLTANELPYRNIIEDYMYTSEFEKILPSLNIHQSMPDMEKLIRILDGIQQSSSDKQAAGAAAYLRGRIDRMDFDRAMMNVIRIIPPPKNKEEGEKFAVARSFLGSDNGYNLLHGIDRSVFPDDRLLAEHIFKIISESKEDPRVRNAFKYYYDLLEKLEPIEFVIRKEIKKNFKMNEIFSDTLDPPNLSLGQKQAFKKLYKYVTKTNPNVMASFDSWDKAGTRGQFVQLLFRYLLMKPEIPGDIKESIKTLESSIKMDGKAALPP